MSHIMFAELGMRVIKYLLDVKTGERVLILGDTASNSDMLEAFFIAAIEAQCEAAMLVYKERPYINYEPPAYIAEAMKGVDAVVDISSKYLIHTEAYREARAAGTRFLMTIPHGIEEYIRRGIIGIDYEAMVRQSDVIEKLFTTSRTCKITSERGTDIEMELVDRPGIAREGRSVVPGDIDYFPGAQVSFAPVEETMNGIAFIDGSIYPPIAKLSYPVEIVFERGRIVDFKGGAEAEEWKSWLKSQDDPKMFNIAHVSIGLNPEARLRGYIIEDERVLGSVTFGIGSQMPDLKGSTGLAKTHSDAVFLMATVTLDGRTVVERGKVLV